MTSDRCPLPALVADDSAPARYVVVRDLRAGGVEVVEKDSVGAATSVDPAAISCALLDLELGDGTGIDIANVLRAARADLPVAFFSSADAGELLDSARAFGPVFQKPAQLELAVAWVVKHSSA